MENTDLIQVELDELVVQAQQIQADYQANRSVYAIAKLARLQDRLPALRQRIASIMPKAQQA